MAKMSSLILDSRNFTEPESGNLSSGPDSGLDGTETTFQFPTQTTPNHLNFFNRGYPDQITSNYLHFFNIGIETKPPQLFQEGVSIG